MFVSTEKESKIYTRTSKLGVEHTYSRMRTRAIFICDNCGLKFTRLLSRMDSKRLSNNYFHCCESCDAKRFAQRKGIEKKRMWDLPASSTQKIGKL